MAKGFSDHEMTSLFYCAGAATGNDMHSPKVNRQMPPFTGPVIRFNVA